MSQADELEAELERLKARIHEELDAHHLRTELAAVRSQTAGLRDANRTLSERASRAEEAVRDLERAVAAHEDFRQRALMAEELVTRMQSELERGAQHELNELLRLASAAQPHGGERTVALLKAELQQQQAELEQLQRYAFADPVTSLPNSRLGSRYLQQELQKAARDQTSLSLAIVDLSALRDFNLHLGRPLGNELLRQVAARIQPLLKADDVLTRGADDEFWIVLPSDAKGPLGLKAATQAASKLMAKLIQALEMPFVAGEYRLQLGVSVGLAVSQGQEPEEVQVQRALLAVQASKRLGRNRLACYQKEMEKEDRESAQLVPRLRKALQDGELCLRFQPIYDLRSLKMWGVESLLRWNHPDHGLMEPDEFCEASHRSGLVVPIGAWTLQELGRAYKKLKSLTVTVDISAQEMMQADFMKRLTGILESNPALRPDSLVLEIHEAHLEAGNVPLGNVIGELKRWGVQIAVDHFAWETLTLRRLQQLSPNFLKLDKKLVGPIDGLPGGRFVRTIAVAAESLGCKLIAEDIETALQLEVLTELGCFLGQGNFLSPAVPIGTLSDKVKLHRLPKGR